MIATLYLLSYDVPMRFFIILLLFCMAASSASATPLDEALAAAYNNNPELQAERERLKATDENIAAAISGFMPSLTASWNKSRTKDDYGTTESSVTPQTSQLAYSQNLFRGGESYYNIQRSKDLVEAGRARLKIQEQAVLQDALIAYIDLVRTRKVLALSINNENVLAEQMRATQERFDLGETTRTDVAQSQSRLARATSNRINAEGEVIAANAEFERIVQMPLPELVSLPPRLPEIPKSLDEALILAKQNNPSLMAASFDYEASQKAVQVRRASLLPSVDLDGRLSDERNRRSQFGGGNLESSSIGVTVTVPLYQSGSEYSAIRTAKRNANRAELLSSATRNNVVNSVTSAWTDIEVSLADITANETSVAAAELALEGVKQEQEIGSRTVLDVLDAEQELFNARVDLIIAQRNAVISHYNMLAAIGQMTAEDLDLDVALYDEAEYYENIKTKFIGF